MTRRVAFPFLTLSDDAVQAEPWELALNEGEFGPVSDHLPDWDTASSIRARRRLRIDVALAAAEIGVEINDLHLAIVASTGTGSGRLPRYAQVCQEVDVDLNEPVADFDFVVPSVSMAIHLMTDVSLADVAMERSELSPRNVGDRLWYHHQKVRLEGQELRFPIEAVDLSGMLGDPTVEAAPWFAHWTPGDWTRDFHGAFRLFLNSGVPEIKQAIEDESALVLQAMIGDVMSQLCEELLKARDPAAEDILMECEAETMGAQARSWLELAWPGRDLDFVRSVLENTPNRFRAALLAAARTS